MIEADMAEAYLNSIATAVPPYDIHRKFVEFAPSLMEGKYNKSLFDRMVIRAGINHRYSFLKPDESTHRLDKNGFYSPNNFPGTGTRMDFFQNHALSLACSALDQLDAVAGEVTHLIVTSCTGFYAPGPDLQIIKHYNLRQDLERTIIGFMGCHAAIHALKQARHIVRSQPDAIILILNLELCTIHLQQPKTFEELLSFLLFGDGCAASLVSAEPEGLELNSFSSAILPDSQDHITWQIGETGFDMMLSGRVPQLIRTHLPAFMETIHEEMKSEINIWAIHPGGRSVLDAVQAAAGLSDDQISYSRSVLSEYGNMSSPSVMFVLQKIMADRKKSGHGMAMAFGPGLSVEAMRFSVAG